MGRFEKIFRGVVAVGVLSGGGVAEGRSVPPKPSTLTRQNLLPVLPHQIEKIPVSERTAVAINALKFVDHVLSEHGSALKTFVALESDEQIHSGHDVFEATRLFLVMMRSELLRYRDLLDERQRAEYQKTQGHLRSRGVDFPEYGAVVHALNQAGKTPEGQRDLGAAYQEGRNLFLKAQGQPAPVKPEAPKKEKPASNRYRSTESAQTKKYPNKFFMEGSVTEQDGHPTIALTFDDGPDPKYTPQILEILNKEQVKATFYLQGMFIRLYPAVVREIVAAGHEIALHSYDHVNLHHVSDPERAYVEQVQRTVGELERLGIPPPRLYRPAEGSITNSQIEAFARHGYMMVNWSIDTYDWQKPPPDQIRRRVLDNTYGGAIVLMHSGGGDRSRTVAALPGIIAELRDKGYVFLTTSQILAREPIETSPPAPSTAMALSDLKPFSPDGGRLPDAGVDAGAELPHGACGRDQDGQPYGWGFQNYCYTESDPNIPDLVSFHGFETSGNPVEVRLRQEAFNELQKLREEFDSTVPKDSILWQVGFYLSEAYRSYADQVAIKKAKGDMAALPGNSEHHLGMAFDLLNAKYRILYEWFMELSRTSRDPTYVPRAIRHGIIPTAPGEAWHYRYVGEEEALRFWKNYRTQIIARHSRLMLDVDNALLAQLRTRAKTQKTFPGRK